VSPLPSLNCAIAIFGASALFSITAFAQGVDTDGDGLLDSVETGTLGTDPLVPDDKPFFTRVGDPENPDDDFGASDLENTGRGYVGQEFEIGKTEVTNFMYALFLNSVAKRDRFYGLYKQDMGDDLEGGIIRSGSQGSYTYTVKAGFGGKPVNFVSLWDVLRYINWLHNWKVRDPQMRDAYRPTLTGADDQNVATTEDGVYALRGTNPENFARHPAAQFFLPDVDEWHKAAYYDPDPGSGRPVESYWDWATQKMNPPTKEGLQAFTTPLFAVGTASGDYFGPSHYRTFDQDGNVEEWVQDALILGGRKTSTPPNDSEKATLGFRVAQPVAGAVVTQETVPLAVEVGQPGNLADEEFAPQLGDPKLGSVNYTFQMGAYEVTNREYAKFLNAKAKEDSFFRLYDTRMGSDAANGGTARTGANGSYVYTVKPGFASKPVVYVSIFSAMRYCNWLHNGGRADSDIESGAYRLLGNIPTNTANLTRNATARYYLPNANEFYKAAYYDPSSLADATFDYWKFATRSDTFDMNNNASTLANVDFSSISSYFGTYGQSGNVGYVSPGSGANAPADEPAAANTGELLEEATNSDDESATHTFRIAAAAGVQSLRPLGDEDNDGMLNAYEIFNDLDPRVNDAAEDPDADGLTNLQEFRAGTDARNKDTDADGMDDGWEVQYGLNPRADDAAQDPDQDGLTNLQEFQAKTDPKDADTDNDGMGDVWEVQYGFDPKNPSDAAGDPDGDGLSNLQEFQARTDPKDADTDNDDLLDGNEVTRGTNPIVADTDGDTLFDGAEVDIHKTDPLKLDTDADGFSDNVELLKLGTDPLSPDLEPIFVRVGDPGNPDADDPVKDLENDGIGYVGQEFEMGATEVTNFMYARFLNSVAADDSLYGLYSTFMGTDPLGGILRTGSRGNYRYAVKAGYEGQPVNFVSAFDAMRYCNWLHNGMPDTQVQNATTTEDGAYPLLGKNYLDGNVPGDRQSVRRSFGARYFLPDEDEWHKAAYFDPEPGAGRPNDSYWPFADQTVAGPGGNFSDTPNRPVAGNSASSHYGTYDQDGNISEWTESTIEGGSQLIVKTGTAAVTSGPLTLHIDIVSNRFWLTGRAQGVFGATQRRAVWAVTPPAQTKDPENQTTNVGIVNDQSAVATLDNSLEIVSVEIGSTVWPGGGFRFALRASGSGPATITGNGESASLNTAAVNAGAVLNFWEGVDLTAVFEVGDSTFGPLIVRSVNPNEEAPEASGPKPAETEDASLGFRVARPVPPSQAVPAHKPLMVPVGLPGNAADYDGRGAVAYEYQIGAYEVTNEEYAAFLNAVAKSDSAFGLYDIRMGFDGQGGIVRDGAPGSYAYAPKPGHEKKPVTFVSCHDAMRYCNWLHNGALPGADTESGAYRLLGGLPGSTGSISRNFGARYFLPDKNEWHKAAYYDPSSKGARTGRYWDFAVRSDNATPSQVVVGGASGLADVNKPGLASFFGTFGQSGNAAEWTEELAEGQRLVLGGGVASDWSNPSVAMAFSADPAEGTLDRGFRIAARADSPAARLLSLQTIKFGKLPAKRVIGTKPLKINLRAKASSKLSVTFEVDDPSNVATFHDGPVPYLLIAGPGQVTVTVRQNGGGTWAPTQVRQTMEIVPRAVRTR
jgi:formylglycine-generating enzyme required for sulfatase activity